MLDKVTLNGLCTCLVNVYACKRSLVHCKLNSLCSRKRKLWYKETRHVCQRYHKRYLIIQLYMRSSTIHDSLRFQSHDYHFGETSNETPDDYHVEQTTHYTWDHPHHRFPNILSIDIAIHPVPAIPSFLFLHDQFDFSYNMKLKSVNASEKNHARNLFGQPCSNDLKYHPITPWR